MEADGCFAKGSFWKGSPTGEESSTEGRAGGKQREKANKDIEDSQRVTQSKNNISYLEGKKIT